MMSMLRLSAFAWAFFLLLAAGLTSTAPAIAQGCLSSGEARQVVGSGKVVPLGRMVQQMRDRGSDVTSARLCLRDGRYVYELTIVSRTGSIRRVTLDAQSGRAYGD